MSDIPVAPAEPGALERTLRAGRDEGRKLLVPYLTGGLTVGGDHWLDVLSANKEIHEIAMKYLESDYQYFDGRQFIETDLQDLNTLLREGWPVIVSHLFIEFKELTRQLANQLQETVEA